MTIRIKHHTMGSNIVNNPLEVKTVRANQAVSSSRVSEEPSESVSETSETSASESVSENMTDAERRNQRKSEYREAASIRDRALQMQKQAEEQIKQTRQFAELMQQAKEDPTVIAKALNMDPQELQRKMFNKMYSIKEDEVPVKEETFEEQTKRRLEQYDQMMAQDKERRQQEARENAERTFQQTKNNFINDKIMPHINESHEFIHRNDKGSCAALVYDLMNQAYQDHLAKGGSQDNFALRAEDVINQMEEELEKRAEAQIMEAKNINKLKRLFNEDDHREYSMNRKDFSKRHSAPTLSKSMGSSAPPLLSSSDFSSSSSSSKRIPFKDRNARREVAKKNLGS